MNSLDTWRPYKKVKRDPIQYTYCVDFPHLCRYQGLRQVIHEGNHIDARFTGLETTNNFTTTTPMKLYTVPPHYRNRLDIIAQEQLGSANYAWVIAYVNKIQDGYTVPEGTTLKIPQSITGLFERGEILSSVSATKLNLGSE